MNKDKEWSMDLENGDIIQEINETKTLNKHLYNPYQIMNTGELRDLFIRYNNELSDLVSEMETVPTSIPYDIEDPHSIRTTRDVSLDIQYTLYEMTRIEDEYFKRI